MDDPAAYDDVPLVAGVKLALDGAAAPALLVAPRGRLVWANRAAEALLGRRPPARLVDLAEDGAAARSRVAAALDRVLRVSTPVPCRLRLGAAEPMVFAGRALDLGQAEGARLALFQGDLTQVLARRVLSVRSIAEQTRNRLRRSLAEQAELMREAARLRRMAMTDPLTGLLNAAAFRCQVQERMRLAGGRSRALLYLDLDNFKPVNDLYGHTAGDALLCALAARLSAALRQGDLVARMGGDEFAVWLDGEAEAAALVRRLKAAIAAPIGLSGLPEPVTGLSVAIGVATWPEESGDLEALIRLADTRMYEDKKAERARGSGHPGTERRALPAGLHLVAGAGGPVGSRRA